jgi:hypothetical protein
LLCQPDDHQIIRQEGDGLTQHSPIKLKIKKGFVAMMLSDILILFTLQLKSATATG